MTDEAVVGRSSAGTDSEAQTAGRSSQNVVTSTMPRSVKQRIAVLTINYPVYAVSQKKSKPLLCM